MQRGNGLLSLAVIALLLTALVWKVAVPFSDILPTSWDAPPEARRQAADVVRKALAGAPDPAAGADLLRLGPGHRTYVTLHWRGHQSTGEGTGGDVAQSLVAAVRDLPATSLAEARAFPGTWVKVDVVTAETDLPADTDEDGLEPVFETGLDGIRATAPGQDADAAGVVLPSDPITEGWFSPRKMRPSTRHRENETRWFTRGDEGMTAVRQSLARLQRVMGAKAEPQHLRLARFRTESFLLALDAARGEAPIPLFRGMPFAFGDRDPSPAEVRRSAMDAGSWLAGQVKDDGTFRYTYLPNRDLEGGGYSTIRHTACAWMLLKIGKRFDVPEWVEAGTKAVRWLKPHMVPVRDEDGTTRVIVAAPREMRGGLGHNAMAVIALAEMHEALSEEEVALLKGLGRSLERMLREKDGGFFESEEEVQTRPADKRDTLDYEPGEAFLALVMLAQIYPDETHWLESARRSAEYQSGRFLGAWKTYREPQTAARMRFVDKIAWQSQALELLARVEEARGGGPNRLSRRWDRAAVEMGRAILASGSPPIPVRQMPSGWPFPPAIGPVPDDYRGGFPLPGRTPRTTPTGSRAEALNAARRSAVALRIDPRPFESALMRVAGYQMRNQYDEVTCYFCPAPERARGAYRAGLTDNEIRIDYIQHMVAGMADTLEWYRE